MENNSSCPGVQAQLKSIKRSFLFYVVGSFLLYSAYGTLLNLQSSINVVDGLGTIALAVTYSCSVFFCLTFSPLVIRRFGPKKSLWVSECAHLIYILTNFYPRFYTMLPAAILLGIGDCMFWICLPIMNKHFAILYSRTRQHQVKDEAYYVNSFSGYYFTIFQCQKIFGNLVSYAALYAFNKPISHNTTTSAVLPSNVTTVVNESAIVDEYRYCGANDCQDPDIVNENLDQYQPIPAALYSLMGILSIMALIAILMHALLIPEGDLVPREKDGKEKLGLPHKMETVIYEKEEDEAIEMLKERYYLDGNSNPVLSSENQVKESPSGTKEKSTGLLLVKRLLLDVIMQLITPKQGLLVPLIMYAGMHYAYSFSEVTRAYTSCVIGVSWVPFHVVVFGAGAVLISYITGKFGHIIGVGGFLTIAAILDAGSYAFNLLWTPSPATSWSLFFLYFALGVSQAIWISQTLVTQVLYFSANPEIACSLWTAVYLAGMAIQYWWSTLLCVRYKIYAQLGIVGAGMLCYGILRNVHIRSKGDEYNKRRELPDT